MSEVRAKLSRLPVSGFKVRLLADQIRGKYVSDALNILSFSKKASSKNLKKLLESAIANAEHNKGLDVDNLFISEIGSSVNNFKTHKTKKKQANKMRKK